jgi:peptide/nickel transport system permease protein
MTGHLLRRLLLALPTLMIVSVLSFMLLNVMPGDAATAIAATADDPSVRDRLREQMGLDRPIPERYVRWAAGLLRGDWGESFLTGEPVLKTVRHRLPVTLEIGVLSTLLGMIVGTLVGIVAAVRRNSILDVVATSVTVAGVALPGFFLGMLLIYIFAARLEWVPTSGYVPFTEDPVGNLKRVVLPSITLATGEAALLARLVRSSLLEVIGEEYVTVARAKGLAPRIVLVRHALRNSLIPPVTALGLRVAFIFGGAVIVETLFALPGMGRLLVDSLNSRDYPVVMAVTMLIALLVICGQLLIDVAYSYLDPRTRLN